MKTAIRALITILAGEARARVVHPLSWQGIADRGDLHLSHLMRSAHAAQARLDEYVLWKEGT